MSTSSPFPRVGTILDKLDKVPDHPVSSHLRAANNGKCTAMYIFTSGSTGENVYNNVKLQLQNFIWYKLSRKTGTQKDRT